MDTLVIHVLNSLFYASILFLIACGLTLVYGVMRIVNMAHGNLYALGAYVAAWIVGLLAGTFPPAALFLLLLVGAGAAALAGAILEPTMLRPLYRRAEEYQLLITFGLLLILEDLIRLALGAPSPDGQRALGRPRQPPHRRGHLSGLQPVRHRDRRRRRRRALGLRLQDPVRRDAPGHVPGHAHGGGPRASTSSASTCRRSRSAASWRAWAAP